MSKGKGGWFGHSKEHGMAAKGIKVRSKGNVPTPEKGQWEPHYAYVSEKKDTIGEQVDFYGRHLHNLREVPLYDESGKQRGTTYMGVNPDGEWSVPDGRIYDARKLINGQILLIYETRHGKKAIRVDDLSKPSKPKGKYNPEEYKKKLKRRYKNRKPTKPTKPINLSDYYEKNE